MITTANFIKSCIYALFLYLGIKTGTVTVLFYLMTIDSILGIIKAFRIKNGEGFKFKVLLWGFISKMAILLIPMIVALIGKGLSFDFSFFVVAVMNVIIVSEGISCITNIIAIKTRKEVKNDDYVTLLLQSIRTGLTRIVKRLLNGIEEGKNNNKK